MFVPWPKTSTRGLKKLAEEYVTKTEQYDRTVCTGPIIGGCIMPRDGTEERSLINSHARRLLEELSVKAQALGWNKSMLLDAIRNARINAR